MNHKDNNFVSFLTRDNIKTMKTAYENLLKNIEIIKDGQGKYYGEGVESILGISKKDVDFLKEEKLLDCSHSRYDSFDNYVWYLSDLLERLHKYKWLYEKEEERFELRFKLYKIFNKENFEAAFDWVFSSPKSEWDKKLRCIKYHCGFTGCESTCGNTLEDAKKLYDLLNS